MELSRAARNLVTWFEKHARKLPWREAPDPYRIWISEVMLQQTQVTTVLPYYARFLAAFPTVETLAAAEEDQVLALWSGLGYYSRARNLHRGAQAVVEKWKGAFPQETAELLEIPSVGPYTAGAIASIAWNRPAPLVDGNVERVFARLYTLPHRLGTAEAKRFFWEKAQEWVTSGPAPRNLNQGLMELGATLCTPKNPECGKCPIQKDCAAFHQGKSSAFPIPKLRRTFEVLHWGSLVLERKGEIFLVRRQSKEWWAGLLDLPRLEAPSALALERKVAEFEQATATPCEELGKIRHTVTHHKLEVRALRVPWTQRRKVPFAGEWYPLSQLEQLPCSSLLRKVSRTFACPPTDFQPSLLS